VTEYELCVRGPNGRKWFAADNNRTYDKGFLENRANELKVQFPNLHFDVFPVHYLRKLAPAYLWREGGK
jgi:hypothetical protein